MSSTQPAPRFPESLDPLKQTRPQHCLLLPSHPYPARDLAPPYHPALRLSDEREARRPRVQVHSSYAPPSRGHRPRSLLDVAMVRLLALATSHPALQLVRLLYWIAVMLAEPRSTAEPLGSCVDLGLGRPLRLEIKVISGLPGWIRLILKLFVVAIEVVCLMVVLCLAESEEARAEVGEGQVRGLASH
ncbi:hypothetical protein HU200_064967 [Digitaria exilis]|uniref:Uncharacterized protein n=1 Tax=Digitaria exilis TaxID=1010633 RepID=A0A835A3P1_9POAL|nr:hypothetical protein HU200_064967 [Digitaria exilis]